MAVRELEGTEISFPASLRVTLNGREEPPSGVVLGLRGC